MGKRQPSRRPGSIELLRGWHVLSRWYKHLTEAELLALINEERAGLARVDILSRLHGRYNKLRQTRERREMIANLPE